MKKKSSSPIGVSSGKTNLPDGKKVKNPSVKQLAAAFANLDETELQCCPQGGQCWEPGSTWCVGGEAYICANNGQWHNSHQKC
jgi:hypothetical protein